MVKCPRCGHTWGKAARKKGPSKCPECNLGRHTNHDSYLRLLLTARFIRVQNAWPDEKALAALDSAGLRRMEERSRT